MEMLSRGKACGTNPALKVQALAVSNLVGTWSGPWSLEPEADRLPAHTADNNYTRNSSNLTGEGRMYGGGMRANVTATQEQRWQRRFRRGVLVGVYR
jgi:hypothetical protein